MKTSIISTILDKRNENAPDIQEIFTRHGSIIKVRLGVHDLQDCNDKGLILLVVTGEETQVQEFIKELEAQHHLRVSAMDILP